MGAKRVALNGRERGRMTPNAAGIPQHIQIEMARRELKLLQQQQAIAEQGIEMLSGVSAELAYAIKPGMPNTDYSRENMRAMLGALVALVSIRLLELQTSHSNLMERIPELKDSLRIADGGIMIPQMRVKG
jgi:hypothetical protein